MATTRDRYILEFDTRGAISSLNGIKSALGGLAVALGAALTTREIIQVTARFEDLQSTLRSVTGSADAAGRAFGFIQRFATQTQFGVEDLTQTFIQLRAAGIEPTENLLRTFTDTAAVTTDQLGTLQAMTDLLSRTTGGGLGLEELERLADRGIPVYRILQEQLGLTRLELSEFGQTAEGATAIVNALLRGLNQEFGGATAERLGNLSTVLSNFQIAMTNLAAEFGAGLSPAIKEITTNVTDFLNANGELARTIGTVLGDALLTVSRKIGEVITQLGLLESGGLQRFTADIVDALANVVEGFSRGLDNFINLIRSAVNGLQSVIAAISNLPGAGFDAIYLDAGKSRDEFIRETQQRYDELRNFLTGPQPEPDRPTSFNDPRWDEYRELEQLLERIRDGSVVIFEGMATDATNASQATAPLVTNLRESAAAMRDSADASVADAEAKAIAAETMRILGETSERTAAQIETTNNAFTAGPAAEYYNSLIESSTAAVSSLEYARMAAEGLNESLSKGVITPEIYAEAMSRLNEVLNSDAPLTFAQYYQQLKDTLAESSTEAGLQQEAIAALSAELAVGTITIDQYRDALESLGSSYLNELQRLDDVEGYVTELANTVNESIASDEFKAKAITELGERLAAETITLQQYEAAMRALGESVRSSADVTEELTGRTGEYIDNLRRQTADARFEMEAANMDPLQRQVAEIERSLREGLRREVEALQELKLGYNDAKVDAQIAAITRETEAAIAAQTELARVSYETANSFSAGWAEAFDSYAQNANDAAGQAQKIFQTTTRGLEDLIVNFAKTGKFEWKGFVSDVLETILRANVQQLISRWFAPEGALGGVGNLLGGLVGAGPGATRGQSTAAPLFVYDVSKGPLGTANAVTNPFGGLGSLFSGGTGGGGLFSSLFGGIQSIFSGIGNLFGGFFATGGMIPPNRFGIVGENGPEIVNGPAMVTPMQPTQVIYNISAVDALSFKQLVARDPGFIHAVAQQGSRRIPVRG